jgi:hypothetical protein
MLRPKKNGKIGKMTMAMLNDIVTVRYYNMIGSSPNPLVDTLLGTDEVRPDTSNEHEIDLTLTYGTYSLYTVSVDRRGNTTGETEVVSFTMASS